MSAPKSVLDLVERFERNLEAYRSGAYKEAQVRAEYVNPFFGAMGWDIYNKQGWAEAYKEVVQEASVEIEGRAKAPDYAFCVGGVTRFYVEAKKPSVYVKEDIPSAYQLRRYAWSAKLPLGIVTDFEEFAVYDCRVKPAKDDKAATARLLYFRFTEYAEKWDEIAAIFSKEAVHKGSFDKFAATEKKKRGTAEVDDAILEEIERWRDEMARNMALRNRLSQHEINYAVQATIDRILFLRICEDRGIEPYGQLRTIAKEEALYRRLCELFRRADERYDSGLFHFEKEKERADPDTLSLRLKVDDKVLQDVIRGLYYPESPYEFSVLPASILGHVYEQFLGKVIRLTESGRAVVEDKPEVRKAGGVYYTPTYIVDYIVKNTVGKLLDGATPTRATKLRVLDPACGSGSFLIAAYQYLLERLSLRPLDCDWGLRSACYATFLLMSTPSRLRASSSTAITA